MSHETRHALIALMCSNDTREALDEIGTLLSDMPLVDLDLDINSIDALDLDLDAVDASMIDCVAYFDATAYADLDDGIDALSR